MSDKSKDETFLARWLSNELTPEEQAAFDAREDAELLRKIAKTSAELEPPERDQVASWEALQRKVGGAAEQKTAKVRRLSSWWRYAAAAIVVLVAGYYFLQPGGDEWTTISAPMAQKMVYELPDGSEVWLNAGSELRFPTRGFEDNRQLELTGEGYFDVVPGSNFVVHTDQGVVQVLGTSFDVYSRSEQFRVVCYTGRVGVTYAADEPQAVLEPGDLIEVVNAEASRRKLEQTPEMPEWTAGNSHFDETSFTTVIEELERQYDLEIDYPAFLDTIQDYSGGFPHRDLPTALQVVFSSVGCQYEVDGSTVTVSPTTD